MTEQQEHRIIEVLDSYKSDDAYRILAKEFNMPQRKVKTYCTWMRSEGRLRNKGKDKWSPAELQSIRQMIDAGLLVPEIAFSLHRCNDAVKRKIIELYGEVPVIDVYGEKWKQVEDTNYEISDHGRLRRKGQRKLISGGLNNGYYKVSLKTSEGVVARSIHRLVAQAFIPNPENKEMVDHIDGNRINNNVTNLRWVSAEENANNQHRLEELTRIAEQKRYEKQIIDLLKALFDTGISKLDLIKRIIEYDEV